MTDSITELTGFIDAAEKNRSYPSNTAMALKSAIRLFEPEMNEQEKESLAIFQERLEPIYRAVFDKNKSKMSAASLKTYLRRVQRVLRDYEKYGKDPDKMANWNPKVRSVSSKQTDKGNKKSTGDKEESSSEMVGKGSGMDVSRFELSLRPGIKATILIPADLKKEEAERIKSLLDALAVE